MNFKGKPAGMWAASGLLALALPLSAADAPTAYLWDSGGQLSIGQPAAWGNGAAKLSRATTYNGDDVLQMTTRNFNEGVIFEMTPPIDLADYQKDGYIRIRLRFRDAAALAGGPAGFPGGPGSEGPFSAPPQFGTPNRGIVDKILPPIVNFQQTPRGGGSEGSGRSSSPGGRSSSPGGWRGGNSGFGSGSGAPGSGAPGGFPGGFPGGEGGEGGLLLPLGPPPQETQIRRLQLNFVLEKGVMSGFIDVPADLEKIKPDDDGWRLFLVPIKDLRSTPNAQGPAQRLIVTSDKEDTFFLAQAAVVVETGQITASIRRPSDQRGALIAELTVKPGLLTLVADVETGTADPLIEWNFDADNVNPDLAPQPVVPLGGEGFNGGPEGFNGGPGGFPNQGTQPGRTSSPGGNINPERTPGVGRQPGRGGAPGFGGPGPEGEGVVPQIPLGPVVHARGLVAKFEYPNEEQDYRVEVTVTDRAGKKAPVKSSILIHVRG